MKLIWAIIQANDHASVTETLVKKGYSVTRMASTGGFLRYGNVTLFLSIGAAAGSLLIALIGFRALTILSAIDRWLAAYFFINQVREDNHTISSQS